MLAVVVAVPINVVDGSASADDESNVHSSVVARVAGLPLVLRTVLSLQKEGVQRVLVMVDRSDGSVAEQALADGRVTSQLDLVELEPGANLHEELVHRVREPFLLAPLDVVVDSAIYRQLLSAETGDAAAIVAASKGRPIGPFRMDGPPFDLAEGHDAKSPLLERLVADGGSRLLEVEPHWWTRVDTKAGRARATHLLFESCRKSVDGAVSRHLNRHVSLFLSKRLVNTPLSPNGATTVTFLFGLLAAWYVLRGGYLNTLIGAALFQLNSILDGVDGELARVRFQQSKLGQWLDTIGDDAALLLFYAALGVGTRDLPHGLLWSTSAWIAAAATALSALLYYTELAHIGSGDLYAIEWDFDKQRPAGWRGRVVIFFRTILKQDFFVFVIFCAAVVGVLHYWLPVFAAGGVITVVAAAVRRVQNARKHHPRQG